MAAQGYTDDVNGTLTSAYVTGVSTTLSFTISTGSLPTSGLLFILQVDAEYFLGSSWTVLAGVYTVTVTGAQGISSGANHSIGANVTGCWLLSQVIDGIRSDQNQIGPIASRPTSGMKKGDRYKCSDSPYDYVYDGSVWQAFVFGFQVTEPVLANFTQVNIGSSTLDTTQGGIIHYGPNAGSNINHHFLAIAIPASGAYYVDAACYACGSGSNGGGAGCGLASAASSSGASAANNLLFESGSIWQWERQLLNSATSFNSNAGQTTLVTSGPLFWTRIYDDRVSNRTFYFSITGSSWIQMYQESRTNLFTPAFATLSMNPYNCQISQHWVHFSIHT